MRVLVFLLFLLATACSSSPPSNAAVLSYFTKHQALIEELAQLGVSHSALRRVEPSQKDSPSYYGTPSQADLAAERRAYEILATIKADYVSYWHDGSVPSNPLLYVEVPFYRWGLALGGYSKCLRYFPASDKAPPKSGNGFTYTPTSKPSWYIAEIDTR